MLPDKDVIFYTEEEKSRVTHLASLNFGPGEIAVLLGKPKTTFRKLLLDETTVIGLAYLKGRLEAKEQKKQAVNDAIYDGNITAVQIHQKESDALDFENTKAEIFDL